VPQYNNMRRIVITMATRAAQQLDPMYRGTCRRFWAGFCRQHAPVGGEGRCAGFRPELSRFRRSPRAYPRLTTDKRPPPGPRYCSFPLPMANGDRASHWTPRRVVPLVAASLFLRLLSVNSGPPSRYLPRVRGIPGC
jgi:hypothetical protein